MTPSSCSPSDRGRGSISRFLREGDIPADKKINPAHRSGCFWELIPVSAPFRRPDGSPEPNIIATLPGLSDSTILVGAHFDYSPTGSPLYNPGISVLPFKGIGLIDNWSGALLLPVLYKSLGTRPREHTFIFIDFAAEETVFTPHSFLDNFMSMHWKEYYDSYLLIAAYLAYIDLKLK
ncbi:MAG: M28 family peptidase [Candidatus Aminicenantales bacterium]